MLRLDGYQPDSTIAQCNPQEMEIEEIPSILSSDKSSPKRERGNRGT